MRCVLVTILLTGGVVLAQTPAAPNPSFEVASVKPNTSNSGSSSARSVKGSFTILNQSARMVIVNAYDVLPERVVGGPSWIDNTRFDVNARAPEGTPDSQLPLMMRTLLAERFKLVARTEMREQPVYALILATPGQLGPNLKPSADCNKAAQSSFGPRGFGPGASPGLAPPPQGQLPACGVRSSSDGRGTTIFGGARTMADLARTLDGTGGRVVVDRTGLTGTFNFELRYARDNLQSPPGNDSDLPTVFTALQEQLGLKLESERGPVEFLVIDSVEPPTPD